jgi:acyl-CoA thioesterase I
MHVTRRCIPTILFTLLLIAAFPSASSAQAKPAQSDHPVIICFGDSLTAGHGTETGHAYPDYLQKLLDSRGYHYRVINRGIDGNTTKDGVNRLKDVLSLHPQIVVVEFGGNDGLRGIPITTTRQNLDQIVAALGKSGTKILLAGITLPPNYGPDYIRQFNATYTDLAQKYHVPLIPFLLKNVYGTPGSMQDDGIHATAQGNQQVALNVLQGLQPLLKK